MAPCEAGVLASGFSKRQAWLGALVLIVLLGGMSKARLVRPSERFEFVENVQIGEAQAWWQGRLDLPERKWDTALYNGKAYNCFPPLFTFLAAAVVPLFNGVPHALIVLGLVLPVVLLSYGLFLRLTSSPTWAAVLSVGLIAGTSLFPVLDKTLRGAAPYYVNHTLASIGLLWMLFEWFGRRRIWVLGLGLIVAALSRQLTVFYALPLIWLAWTSPGVRSARVALCALPLVVIGAVYMTLNTLKFGHPLESGYRLMYVDRPKDDIARDAAAHGLFSAHFVPRNLYYMNLGLPRVHRISMAGQEQVHLRPNRMGTGIWWTTPWLLWLFVLGRAIWRDPGRRAWLLAAAAVAATLLFYHNTGSEQRGFNRFSLDYLPVLLGLLTPACVEGRRRWVTLAMIAWSVVYFRWLI